MRAIIFDLHFNNFTKIAQIPLQKNKNFIIEAGQKIFSINISML